MLLELLILLAGAKVAAEVAERLKVPAVLAEIVAGIVLGPSLLGWVVHGEVLVFLGELGVILLLLEVGLEMDLGELGAVGKASLLVAVAGVVLPFVGGFGVASALGQDLHPAIFVGAALTATSVGITARVFGDLRALATVEARTVLGAAVADDVLGLVILTVVVRIVQTGSVSVLSVLGVVSLAVVFLVTSSAAGLRLAPAIFRQVDRRARSAGALIVAAVAFTLTFAEAASLARLAPIIGAFVAGLALGRVSQAERIRRELTPIGHVLVPVFFVSIGIDVDVRQFLDPSVLGLALGLLAVAVIGKVAAALAALGSPGDRWLIGLGMLPRGEVGLIFAGIGLREGVLGEDLYAALLLVVLGTTLATPPLLRWRLGQVFVRRRNAPGQAMPADGWFVIDDQAVELRGRRPSTELAVQLALEAALLVAADRRPGPQLLDWFAGLPRDEDLAWDRRAQHAFFDLLRHGNARSWRFLETTGMVDRILPELAATMARRREDASELDPVQVLRWATLEEVADRAGCPPYDALEHPEWLLVAALVLDVAGDAEPPLDAARAIVRRLRLGVAAEQEVELLLAERGLLRAAASRPDGLDEARVLPLAVHLQRPERARALHVLTLATGQLDPWLRRRVDEVAQRVLDVLALPRDHVEDRRREVASIVSRGLVADRVAHAPRSWLLSAPATDLARQAALVEPLPPGGRVRVQLAGSHGIEVAGRDRPGFLASVTAALDDAGLEVCGASTATWPDGGVAMAFDIEGGPIDTSVLAAAIEAAGRRPRAAAGVPDARLAFDAESSPWHTVVDVSAPDRPALLHAIATACASSGCSIRSAQATTERGRALDRFEVVNRRGEKLTHAEQDALRETLRKGSATGSGRPWTGTRKAATVPKHSGHNVETARP